MVLLMFLNDEDKQIIHYILTTYCQNCGLNPEDYFSYNQFIGMCPRPDCKERGMINGIIRSDHHHVFEDCMGTGCPRNDGWKRFFRLRKGWI